MATLATPTRGTPQASTLNQQAAAGFTGQPAPFLPQVLQPIPDPTVLKTQWESMFPTQNLSPTFYADQAAKYIAGLQPVPTITAPVIPGVQVAFPEGDADRLAQSLYNQQAGMAIRELERREAAGMAAQDAQLAQTGLADSGVAIGQRANLREEFDEQIGATSNAIAEGAVAKSLEAKLAVAQQQANIDMQRGLANAQLDYQAQQSNARNILEHGAMAAQAYTQALGLDAAHAETLRGTFIQFIDSQTRAALGQSEVARAVLADIFNSILQSEALDIRTEELALARRTQSAQENQFESELAFNQQQLAQQNAISQAQLNQQGSAAYLDYQAKQYPYGPGLVTDIDRTTGLPSSSGKTQTINQATATLLGNQAPGGIF